MGDYAIGQGGSMEKIEKIVKIMLSPISTTIFIVALIIGLLCESVSLGFDRAEQILIDKQP